MPHTPPQKVRSKSNCRVAKFKLSNFKTPTILFIVKLCRPNLQPCTQLRVLIWFAIQPSFYLKLWDFPHSTAPNKRKFGLNRQIRQLPPHKAIYRVSMFVICDIQVVAECLDSRYIKYQHVYRWHNHILYYTLSTRSLGLKLMTIRKFVVRFKNHWSICTNLFQQTLHQICLHSLLLLEDRLQLLRICICGCNKTLTLNNIKRLHLINSYGIYICQF